ncbi:hypothetical protein [Streptomyces tricolor]
MLGARGTRAAEAVSDRAAEHRSSAGRVYGNAVFSRERAELPAAEAEAGR